MEITSTSSERITDVISNNHRQPHLSSSLDITNEDFFLRNVTIVCDMQEFQASRSALIDVSPYFFSALTRGWKETVSGRVELPTISAESMERILEFIATGQILSLPANSITAAALLEDANYLQIDSLIEFSYKILSDNYLTVDNFYELYDFIEVLGNQWCLARIVIFLSENISYIIRSNDFMRLKPLQLMNILHHVDFDKNSMEEIFAAILKWTEHEISRCDVLEELIIIFEQHCWESSTFLMRKNVLLDWTPCTLHCLSDLLKERKQIIKVGHDNGTGKAKLVLLGEYVLENEDGNEAESNLMRTYDVDKDEWLTTKELPFKLEEGMAIVSYRSHIYLFGGERGEFKYIPSKKVIRYCPLTNIGSVITEGKLLHPVYQAGAGVLRDSIFVVNGAEHYKGLDKTVQCFNLKDGSCREVASTTYRHFRPHVLPFNDDFLYIVSNSDGDEQFVVERYSLPLNQWTMITQIPGFDFWSSAAMCDANLVLHYDKFLFRTYDIYAGQWTEWGFDYLKRELIWGMWCTKKNGKLVILGLDDRKVLHSLDVETMEWETRSCPNMERWGLWGKLYITCI